MRILLDSNVIISAFASREEDAFILVRKCISGEYDGCLVSKQFTDIYYVLRKYLDVDKRKRVMNILLNAFTVISFGKHEIEAGLKKEGEFGDNVLIAVQHEYNIPYIITSDKKGFSSTNALSPHDFLAKQDQDNEC